MPCYFAVLRDAIMMERSPANEIDIRPAIHYKRCCIERFTTRGACQDIMYLISHLSPTYISNCTSDNKVTFGIRTGHGAPERYQGIASMVSVYVIAFTTAQNDHNR